MPCIVNDEERRLGPQPHAPRPGLPRVPAAGALALLPRLDDTGHRTASRRLAADPTALGTRPKPILGQAPSPDIS